MTYDDAIEAMVSVADAIHECKSHGNTVAVSSDGNSIIDTYDNDIIATIDDDGNVAGRDILIWLGY